MEASMNNMMDREEATKRLSNKVTSKPVQYDEEDQKKKEEKKKEEANTFLIGVVVILIIFWGAITFVFLQQDNPGLHIVLKVILSILGGITGMIFSIGISQSPSYF